MPAPLIDSIVRRLLSAKDGTPMSPHLTYDDIDPQSIRSLRLEALLGSIDAKDLGDHPVNHYASQIVKCITEGRQPNHVHRFLAEGLSSAAIPAVFTTNWDTLIEDSFPIQNVTVGWHPNHFHDTLTKFLLGKLHGTASHSNDDQHLIDQKRLSLVTDPTGLGGPLPASQDRTLGSFLHSDSYPFCVVGYSGSDPDIHPVLRKTKGRLYWVLYSKLPKETIDKEKERLNQLAPESDIRVIVADMDDVVLRLGRDKSKCSPSIFSGLPYLFSDMRREYRLLALGRALSHAAAGSDSLRCFEAAKELAPDDDLVNYSVAQAHAVMYKYVVPCATLPGVWRRATSSGNVALAFDARFFFLLALENIAIRKWRLSLLARPLCALLLSRPLFDLNVLRKQLKCQEEKDEMGWLRSNTGQNWSRLANRFVQYALTKTRLHFLSSYRTSKSQLDEALSLAQKMRSPSLQGQVYRYLGRLHSIYGESELATECYEHATYWFSAIDDNNGVTEVAKYRLKSCMATLRRGEDVTDKSEVYQLAKRLEAYQKERERLPPLYAQHVVDMVEIKGSRLSAFMVRCVWPPIMRSRFYF